MTITLICIYSVKRSIFLGSVQRRKEEEETPNIIGY